MEITPVTPVVRTAKVRTTKSAVPKSSSKAAPPAAVKPDSPAAPRKRKLLTKTQVKSAPANLNEMIATTAYYFAEQRHFAPGHELQDWLAAERLVRGSATGN